MSALLSTSEHYIYFDKKCFRFVTSNCDCTDEGSSRCHWCSCHRCAFDNDQEKCNQAPCTSSERADKQSGYFSAVK